MNVLDQIMGVKEAGEMWGLSADRVKGLCQSKEVKCKKIGNSWVLDKNQPNPKGGLKMNHFVLWDLDGIDGLILLPANEIEQVENDTFDGALEDGFYGKVYEYWDGSNMKRLLFNEDIETETSIVASVHSVSLDKWDGRNYTYGGVGFHRWIYKVYEMDGEEVKDCYLINDWSQWEGDLQKGFVIEDIDEFFKDKEDYSEDILKDIKEL